MLHKITRVSTSKLTFALSLLLLFAFAALSARADDIHFTFHSSAGWIDQDLTSLTGGTLPNPGTGVVAFNTIDNGHLHVYYSTTDQHVHQLYFNGTNWVDQDLTAIASGPLSLGFGGISGFTIGHNQHIFYLGADLHVHQLYSVGASWADQDVTVLAGGPVTDFDSLVAYPTTPDNHFHVFYLANNSNDLHELNFNGSSWSDLDLRVVAHALPATRGWMAGFAVGTQQHLFFGAYSPKDKLHFAHLAFKNSKWINEDLTAKVHGLPLSPAAGITAFSVSANQIEAYCVTNDMDVHQFTWKNNAWTDEDLDNNQPDNSINQMVAFRTIPNNQFHLFYPPNDLYDLTFNGHSWSDTDLTVLTGGGIPNGSGGMAGFAIKNLQYVFYVAE
jgi:hypothetical protein